MNIFFVVFCVYSVALCVHLLVFEQVHESNNLQRVEGVEPFKETNHASE